MTDWGNRFVGFQRDRPVKAIASLIRELVNQQLPAPIMVRVANRLSNSD